MSIEYIIALLVVGFIAGFISSMIGIGGGIITVPALVLLFGMTQKMAQGTSLGLLALPVAFLGALNYYKAGFLDWKVSVILALTFVVGSYIGSKMVVSMDMSIVKKIFAVFMIIIAIKYLFFDK